MTMTQYASDGKKRGALILALRKAIKDEFTAEDWKEFGYVSGQSDYIQGHKRLIRSLSWGDDDYGQCVLEALEHFIRFDLAAVEQLINHEKLTDLLLIDIPELSVFVRNRPEVVKSHTPARLSSSDVVRRALNDAEHLMHASGPISAVDRLHTAMHGYFRSLCLESGIAVPDEASLTLLFKLLRQHHPSLQSFGLYDKDLVRVLQGFAQAVDALNSLRNNGSVAHPSDDLLGEAEAHLAVNAIRTIFNYISAKVGH